MVILTDTREQKPLFVQRRCTLNVGDYTTEKLKDVYHIERKSLADLYQTLTHGNKRFKYELFRAAYNHTTLVVYVEGCKADFIAKRFPGGSERKFSSTGLEKLLRTFETKYHLEFFWHTNRARCRSAVEKELRRRDSIAG